MKIDSNRLELAPDVAATETITAKGRKAAEASPAPEGDRVQLSAGAGLLARATQALADVPEIRQDVVDQMKEAIATGEAGFDPLELADKILDDILEP
jgi:negative regulator of flagellin synthesis FlgM